MCEVICPNYNIYLCNFACEHTRKHKKIDSCEEGNIKNCNIKLPCVTKLELGKEYKITENGVKTLKRVSEWFFVGNALDAFKTIQSILKEVLKDEIKEGD